jgi:hypothetical protein
VYEHCSICLPGDCTDLEDERIFCSLCLYFHGLLLLSEVQGLNQLTIAFDIMITQVVQQPPPLTYQHEQATARMMVLFVNLEMFGKIVDPPCKDSHLDIRRAGITPMPLELFDDLLLFLYI